MQSIVPESCLNKRMFRQASFLHGRTPSQKKLNLDGKGIDVQQPKHLFNVISGGPINGQFVPTKPLDHDDVTDNARDCVRPMVPRPKFLHQVNDGHSGCIIPNFVLLPAEDAHWSKIVLLSTKDSEACRITTHLNKEELLVSQRAEVQPISAA